MNLLLLIHVFFFGHALQDKSPDTLVSCHFKDAPFNEFCEFITAKTGVNIYIHEAWAAGLTVTMDADNIRAKTAVELALKGKGLEVSLWNGDLVVMPGEKLPE